MPNFKTQDQILEEMKDRLRGLIPGVNLSDDSEWVVKMKITAGAVAGLYADQYATYLDIFPITSRRDALFRHKADWGLPDVEGAPWRGTVTVSGIDGSTVAVGERLIAASGEREYKLLEPVLISGGIHEVQVEAVAPGVKFNVDTGVLLTFVATHPQIDSTAVVASTLVEGSNDETETELAERIQDHEQMAPSGGNQTDYERLALEASSEVLSAAVQRGSPRGPGTLDVWITAGTEDIAAAIVAGETPIRIPSAALRQSVLDYIVTKQVATDNVAVPEPTEVAVALTIALRPLPGYVSGGGGSNDVNPLARQIIDTYLYSLAPDTEDGPVEISASELERELDALVGVVIDDRKVFDIGSGTTNRVLNWGELAIPGVIVFQAWS